MLNLKARLHAALAADGPNGAVRRLFMALKDLGLNPSHVIDVGGNRGDWTRTVLSVFPDACVTMFEPQTELQHSHTDLNANSRVDVLYRGAGDIDGTLAFTIHERDDSSSFLYASDQAEARGFKQSKIDIARLDTVVTASRFGLPQVVKIDAEGFDLRVLEGAQATLATCDIVLVEAAVANRDYPNTLLAVIQTMDDYGYRLFDFTDLNRTPNRKILWLVEAVFVRKGSLIDENTAKYD
jgi:FkbM family methyltransferase